MPNTNTNTPEGEEAEKTYLGAYVLDPPSPIVRVVVFGKAVSVGFDNPEIARDFVTRWNDHVDAAWQEVREANGAILHAFCHEMGKEGAKHGIDPGVMEECARACLATLQSDVE